MPESTAEGMRMNESPVDLITISREFGAGGSELARELGARLGWPVLDRDVVKAVAERLEIDPRTVEQMDEHPPRLLARLSAALLMTPPEYPLSVDTSGILSPDAVADATRAAILEAAESPPLIVVGHGGQSLFHKRAGTIHLRLVAPLPSRVRRICARMDCDPQHASNEAKKMDDARAAYVRRYFQCDVRDPLLYDFVFNTGRVTLEQAADAVVALVAARNAQPSIR
jgi:cytidylate kinase